ncbi:MAG: hypothetical protein HYX71_12695 [Opitutae bacterium]|nr:hypothetical protein [Opitutae bacterium]
METAAQLASRLLTALQELVDREGIFLRGGYYDLAAETRGRADPLIRQLVELAGQPGLEAHQRRVAALQARSAEHEAFISGKMAELSAELRRIELARHRAAHAAPAYARDAERGHIRWRTAV